MLDELRTDLRLGCRTLWKSKGFTAAAIGTLALGLGACTAMFSVVHAVLWQPLPYRDPDRLFVIWEQIPSISHLYPIVPLNAYQLTEWQKRSKSFEQIAAWEAVKATLTGSGQAEQLSAARVSFCFLSILGVAPQLGRGFTLDDQQPGQGDVVLISDALWRRRFGADPAVIGRKILLNGFPNTIVGVLPPRFAAPRVGVAQFYRLDPSTEVWWPLDLSEAAKRRAGDHNYGGLGRLRPNFSPAQALAELESILQDLLRELPQKTEIHAGLAPLQADMVRPVRGGLWLLMGAVGAVLLIICVNIGNLLLARSRGRQKEFAIRCALGATAGRVVRQMLRESLLLAFFSGALGLVLAHWLVRLVVLAAPVDLPRLDQIRVDLTAFLFALALSVVAALLFGSVPAWRLSSTDPQEALRSGPATGYASPRSRRAHSGLVAAQVALSAVLLIAAGLLLNSLVRILRVDRGYEVDRILAVDVRLPNAKYRNETQTGDFFRRALDAWQSLPGVVSAGVISTLPLSGDRNVSPVLIPGAPAVPWTERPVVSFRYVSPDYFRTMGIPLVRGRWIDDSDARHRVALVSRHAAERLWPGEDPIGKEFHRGTPNSPPIRVIGVVGDIRGSRLDQAPALMAYQHQALLQMNEATIVVRTSQQPQAVAAALRSEISRIDPEAPLSRLRTMAEVVAASVAHRRFQVLLLSAFAGAALFLACLGIYGVVSYAVGLRTNEIGIRMALGGQASGVRNLILRQSFRPIALGLGLGVVAAILVSRLLASLLFGVPSHDPLTYSIALGVLGFSSLIACYIPARRATRVDPVIALRWE